MTPIDKYICRRCADIEGLLTDAAGWARKDEELGAHLASYICVLILGTLEDCIEYLVVGRAAKTGDNEIKNYVVKRMKGFRNPDWGSISGLLGEFSDIYKMAFTDSIPYDSNPAEALKDVLNNKNSLAHVGTSNLNLTVTDVGNYYRRIIPILETLEKILA